MQPVVAIVSARPETIIDDYARLMDLAGLKGIGANSNTILAVEAWDKGWKPGLACPPWQVEALLKSFSDSKADHEGAPFLLPVKNDGPSSDFRGVGWQKILDRLEHQYFTADALSPAPYRPEALLPALEGALPQGVQFSPHLRGKNLFLLSTMSISSGGILGANVSFLDSFLARGRKNSGKIPEGEILAEVVTLANEVFSSVAAVTDLTVISVAGRAGRRVSLQRNLLVAGNDPVAVDAVLVHLAGLDTNENQCLSLCQDRSVGVADLGGIRLVGETEWLDLDFQVPEDTFASGNQATNWFPGKLINRLTGQGGHGNPTQDSAWDRLYRDY